MPQVKTALAAWPLGYESPLSVKNKSKPVLGLVLPNNNLEAPTDKLRSSNARIERLIGRHDLNLLLISIAVIISIIDVTLLSPKSSTNCTNNGVSAGETFKNSLSRIFSSNLLIQELATTCWVMKP